ncbi:MAG: hypothetical protein RIQ94_1927, partial [Pseudomonadota bacterium]
KEDEVIQPNMYNKQEKIDTNKVIKTNINKNKPAGQV